MAAPDSVTAYVPAASVFVTPCSEPSNGAGVPAVPVICIEKSDAVAVLPCLLTTCLTTVSVGAMSSLVIVQVLSWPTVTLSAPPASQSPENVAA